MPRCSIQPRLGRFFKPTPSSKIVLEAWRKRSARGVGAMEIKIKKPGDDLLFHRTGSTIGVEGLNFRVRDGNGCFPLTIITRHVLRMRKGEMGKARL
jgi:hypothetical protein